MIPTRAILSCQPCVGLRISRCQRTLSDSSHTIHVVGVFLLNAMPVYARAVVLQGVLNGDLYSVAPIYSHVSKDHTWADVTYQLLS